MLQIIMYVRYLKEFINCLFFTVVSHQKEKAVLISYKIEISKAQLTQLGRRLRTAGFNRIFSRY